MPDSDHVITPATAGPFVLGAQSSARLDAVHPDLAALVRRAIQLTTVDFAVHEGLRTPARQAALVRAGASWTLDSRHLTGHAVDLVPWVDVDGDGRGELRWDWPLIYPIAAAMRRASLEAATPLVWGGVWDTALARLDGSLEDAVADYVARRRALGKPARIDGPHFELPRAAYPVPA